MAAKVQLCSPVHCLVTLTPKFRVALPEVEQPGVVKLPQRPGSGTPAPAPATTLAIVEPAGQVSVPVVALRKAPEAHVSERAAPVATCAAGRHEACAKNLLRLPEQ